MKYNFKDLLEDIKNKLLPVCKSEHEAEQQALWLIEEITQEKYTILLAQNFIELKAEKKKRLYEWVEQRVKHKKPIQYIIGFVPFLNLKIKTKPPILIPRPETEEWVNWLIKKLKVLTGKIKILDIGTGSGCIALALAKHLDNALVLGTDINLAAIELAKENRKINKINNAEFIKSDFYNNLSNYKFDIIVSNPPYICKDEWENLDPTIKNWEDKKALVVGKDCLFAYKEIIKKAENFLTPNYILEQKNINRIFLEIGINQDQDIKRLFAMNGYKNIEFFRDLEGKLRVVSAGF